MSLDDRDVNRLDPTIYAPILEDIQRLPLPFTIPNPLTEADLPDRGDGRLESFIDEMDTNVHTMAHGYTDTATDFLNREQWLRAAAQQVAAILRGFRATHPTNEVPSFLASLNPDELDALNMLGQGIGSLFQFFGNPTSQKATEWDQCLKCLKVCHTTVTAGHWAAQVKQCNQDAEAARRLILQKTIEEYRIQMHNYIDQQKAVAHDHVILQLTSANPPDLLVHEPRVAEWIARRAKAFSTLATAKAEDDADEAAKEHFVKRKAVFEANVEHDLQLLRDNANEIIARAREGHEQDIADLHASLREEKEKVSRQGRIEEKRASRAAKRPDPINTYGRSITRSRHASRAPSPTGSVISGGHEDTEMIEDNSPTPKADIPPAPTDPLAAIMAAITQLNSRFTTIDARLDKIEYGPTDTDTIQTPQTGPGYGYWAQREAEGADMHFLDRPEPPRIDEAPATAEAEAQEHDQQYTQMQEEFDCQVDEEQEWFEYRRQKKAAEKMPNPVQTGTADNPIVLSHDTTHVSASEDGEWKMIGKPAPKPSAIAFPTMSGKAANQSYASHAKKVTNQPTMVPGAVSNVPLTSAQLDNPKTTRVTIVNSAFAVFGIKIGSSHNKQKVIQIYKQRAFDQLTAAQGKSPAPTSNSANSTAIRPRARRVETSVWTIRRRYGQDALVYQKPFGGDAYRLVMEMQTALRQAVGNPEPPVTILGGRWSSNLTNNFILTIAGKPSHDMVLQFERPLLATGFDRSFQLVPSDGFVKIVLHGVPCKRDSAGSLVSPAVLRYEISQNIVAKQARLIDGPAWSQAARNDPNAETGAVTFIILDDANRQNTNRITRNRLWVFGTQVNARQATPSTPYQQCQRCFFLSHPTERCPKPETFKKCGLCGFTGHTAKTHCALVCRKPHNTITCSCTPSCFNCKFAKKNPANHWATDPECPLKKRMRGVTPPTETRPTVPISHLAAPSAGVPMVPTQQTTPTIWEPSDNEGTYRQSALLTRQQDSVLGTQSS